MAQVNYIEHVQLVVSLNASRRGDVTMYSVSPAGTRSMILSRRPKDDDAKDGFVNWPFMTTHTWGENPRGKWRLIVRFESDEAQSGFLNRWSLVIHGTQLPPYQGIQPLKGHLNSKLEVVQKAHKRQA